MQERYVLFICASGKLNSLWQSGQVREENSKLLLTSLDTLTPQHETWKIPEKDLLLNRAGNCLNITCLMDCLIWEISITVNTL